MGLEVDFDMDLTHSFTDYLREFYSTRKRRMAFKGSTQGDHETWKVGARSRLLELLGGRCESVPPLSLKRKIIEEREDVSIERLLYQTRPGLWAPAYLVIPKNRSGRLPAILCPPGHGDGMNQVLFESGGYKQYPIELAKQGFVTIVPENIGFGERVGRADDATHQFSYLAVNLFGESMMGFLVWDLQRALDVLDNLPNVDPSNIGCYGLSLGGELTLLTTAIDERIKCACISGFFTSYASTFLSVCHCGCGYVHGLATEFEHVDLAGLIVPRPLLLETGIKDTSFPTPVTRTSGATLSDIYALYNATDRLGYDIFEGEHEISGRRAHEWFKKWLS